MKKVLIATGILVLLLILFRGTIYRFAIRYNAIGTRPAINLNNSKLIEKIDQQSMGKTIDLETIVRIADDITTSELSFTTGQAFNNPNQLADSKHANCVGYSAMFNSIANYLIENHQLQSTIESKHIIGQLELFGIDLHQFFDGPFFRDHDFNQVTDQKTGDLISIDPTVSDYLRINRINQKNEL